MKLTKQQIGISIVALVMFGIIIGIVVHKAHIQCITEIYASQPN